MPYFNTQLLSAWPTALISKTSSFSGPQRIPSQVLASMKYNDKVAYATLPKELRGRRNMAMSVTRKSGARFRSDKGVEVARLPLDALGADVCIDRTRSFYARPV